MKSIVTVAATAVFLIGLAGSASAGFRPDSYTFTFYPGPKHQQGSQTCWTFTKTGAVADFKNSGTWASNDTINLKGNWVYDSGLLRLYGVSAADGNEDEVVNVSVDLATGEGGYDAWFFGKAPLTAAADGLVTIARKCL